MNKKCSKCQEQKAQELFHKNKNGKYGLSDYCKECSKIGQKEQHRKWYLANKERHKAQIRKQKAKNPEKYKQIHNMANHRRRVRIRNGIIEEGITFEEIYKRDKGICKICNRKCSRKDASLDHIIPIARDGPHTRANMQLAHKLCNSIKGIN